MRGIHATILIEVSVPSQDSKLSWIRGIHATILIEVSVPSQESKLSWIRGIHATILIEVSVPSQKCKLSWIRGIHATISAILTACIYKWLTNENKGMPYYSIIWNKIFWEQFVSTHSTKLILSLVVSFVRISSTCFHVSVPVLIITGEKS